MKKKIAFSLNIIITFSVLMLAIPFIIISALILKDTDADEILDKTLYTIADFSRSLVKRVLFFEDD